ncbi:hypothetical protein BDR04DRAFT_1127818 [Suillus decipiens]|nr:hypothetical protein BDR04DRAFT_1127818 [Suillus decipiens]
MNKTLSTLFTIMLEESKLLKYFWVDAISTAAYITGCSPAAGIKEKTPYETLFNWSVDPSFFHPFECPAYALIPRNKHAGKFHQKGCKPIMIGYMHDQKAYKLMDLVQCSVLQQTYHLQ